VRKATKLSCLVLLSIVLVSVTAGADGRSPSKGPSGCPFVTQEVVYPPGTSATFRFWRVGVSCAKVERLFKAFWRHANAGRCEGSRCIVSLPGGWQCSGFSAAESAETKGAEFGCYKGPRVQFRAYPLMQGRGFLSANRKIWCSASALSASDDRHLVCVSKAAPGHFSGVGAVLGMQGPPQLCEELTAAEAEQQPPPLGCSLNFDSGAPVLPAGSTAEDGGFRCSAGQAEITCTFGEGKSQNGFVISQTTVAAT
jgi:hypothetical protein